MKRWMMVVLTGGWFMSAALAQQGDVKTVTYVDLQRYAGKWHEIARLPNRFQEQCAGDVTAEYAIRQDGQISVVNRCRKTDGSMDEVNGIAKVADPATNAKLAVRFAPDWLSWLPLVWGDYWIIGLSPDYTYAVVGDPERKFLWILSRRTELSGVSWNEAVDVAASQGFDVDRLVKTSQGR